MAKVSVICPAAGAGKRFGPEGNKIFQPLGGRAVFLRTLEVFAALADVCQIQLVAAPADMETLRRDYGDELSSLGATLVEGGETRSKSVRNALANVDQQAELICVHDAVRPCICRAWVQAVFHKAEQTGAAILAYPVHATLKRVTDTMAVEQTIGREKLWQAQTPQVFEKKLLTSAYRSGRRETDDAAMVEAAGHAVSVVMGDPRNIKITTPADLALARAVIDSLPKG